jgi:hypothetical protein
MLLLSLNVRGIGGTLKFASFRRLVDHTRPRIIFLQETLVFAQKARDFLYIFRLSWTVCSVNSVGNSGGLLVAWDTNLFELIPYLMVSGILVIDRSLLHNQELSLLNVYGACLTRKTFWNTMEDNDILSIKNLILAGDFNLILSLAKAWGGSRDGIIDDYYK